MDDSLDIVFASQSGETSVSVNNQPFHKYTVAPAEHDNSVHSDSGSDWDQFDDSGYHKNSMVLVTNIIMMQIVSLESDVWYI